MKNEWKIDNKFDWSNIQDKIENNDKIISKNN